MYTASYAVRFARSSHTRVTLCFELARKRIATQYLRYFDIEQVRRVQRLVRSEQARLDCHAGWQA